LKEGYRKRIKISFFGHFGQINFGNESTLQAILYHFRQHLPDAEFTSICTNPDVTRKKYDIGTVSMTGILVKPEWLQGHPLTRFLRKIIIGIPSELYRWLDAFRALKGVDMLIVPGTGLLTDAYGRVSWGPYSVFKWSLIAKLRRSKLLFVSVGAGPIYGFLGRYLIKSALSWADFRSYRDNTTLECLKATGFQANNDRVRPDLAFSLPVAMIPHGDGKKKRRSVVGLGVMQYAGKLSVDKPSHAIYRAYLENLVVFVRWLLDHEYDVRLMIGDTFDRPVVQEFKGLLRESIAIPDGRIVDEPVSCVEDLLSQLAATDLVVATRFHNVLFALLVNKPVISISFHHKCSSLMSEMGLSEYCQDINHLSADRLIEQFCDLEKNSEMLKPLIKQKTEEFRRALDEQYKSIFEEFFGSIGARPFAI
jgi:polysaccharide pyruvyl transferase WcaK-like protein